MLQLLQKASGYAFNSLRYLDFNDIRIDTTTDLIVRHSEAILVCKKAPNEYKLLWGAESAEAFRQAVEEMKQCWVEQCTTQPGSLYIEFVEPAFVEELLRMDFVIASHFDDYWLENLTERLELNPNRTVSSRSAVSTDYRAISQLTLSCDGRSRGFKGESVEFVQEWCESQDSCVLLAEEEGQLLGVCFVQVYGWENAKGPVVWIRELAVHPESQNRGIGRELVIQALRWGTNKGATRSFLAVDRENAAALHLYRQIGYRPTDEPGQINMRCEQ